MKLHPEIKFSLLTIVFFWIFQSGILAETPGEPKTLSFEPFLSGKAYTFNMTARGSYYLFDNWQKGQVTYHSGEKTGKVNLKYNTYLDELIWLPKGSGQAFQLDKGLVSSFSIIYPGSKDQLLFKKISPERKNPRVADGSFYARVFYSGDVMLMGKQGVRETGQRMVSEEGGRYMRPNLEPHLKFFVIDPDEKVHEVGRFRRRSLINMFPDHSEEIRAAFRKKNLATDTEDDMIQAVKNIDRILSEN